MSKAPVYLKVEKTIDAPLERVWETVALGFGEVAAYNPEIKASRFDSDLRAGVGTRRHCEFPNGGYIEEEITDWQEGASFALAFTASSVPMAILRSKFSFAEAGAATHVTQEFWYRMKAPLGWMSGFMKARMARTLQSGLDGLDRYLQATESTN